MKTRTREINSYAILFQIDFLEILNPKIIVERFFSESPEHLLIAPKYGLKNFELVHKIEKRLQEKDSWQGKLFTS